MRSFLVTCVFAVAVIGWSTHFSSTALGGGITTSPLPKGPYAEYTVIDAGLYLCNGQPCFKADGGFDDAVDLVSNQTVLGVKTWGSRNDFPGGLDASVVFTPTVNFTGGSNGIGSISGNGASSINIATRGQNVQVNNTGIAITIADAGNSRINVGSTGSGTTSGVAFSTGEVGAFGSMVGNTHANRLAAFNSTQPTIGYCTTDNAWYWGDGTNSHDITCSTDSCSSQSFCPADGGSCWTGQSSRGVGTLSGYYDNQLLGNGKALVQARMPISVVGKSLTWMPTKTGLDALNTFTVDVYDVTTTTVLCVTGNIACNNTAGTAVVVSCSSPAAAGDDIQVRINEGSCGGPIFGTGAWTYQ